MFADDVFLTAGPRHVRGRAEAVALLETNPENATLRLEWSPIRAGMSSDGLHGFTLGYMSMRVSADSARPAKYLAYWIRGADGWRVAVYRRVPRPPGDVQATMLEPSRPTPALPRGDAATVQRHAAELRAAEKAFSDEAQRIGLGPAFAKWGAPDAMNAGGGPAWVQGPASIAEGVSAGLPATGGPTLTWESSEVIVAATGDLGVSIGYITISTPVPGETPRVRQQPFFTIWKRATPADPWRYVAE